jgi:hypothetical protein
MPLQIRREHSDPQWPWCLRHAITVATVAANRTKGFLGWDTGHAALAAHDKAKKSAVLTALV